MVILYVFLLVISCYVGCANMPDESKTSYFIVVTIFVFILILTKIL